MIQRETIARLIQEGNTKNEILKEEIKRLIDNDLEKIYRSRNVTAIRNELAKEIGFDISIDQKRIELLINQGHTKSYAKETERYERYKSLECKYREFYATKIKDKLEERYNQALELIEYENEEIEEYTAEEYHKYCFEFQQIDASKIIPFNAVAGIKIIGKYKNNRYCLSLYIYTTTGSTIVIRANEFSFYYKLIRIQISNYKKYIGDPEMWKKIAEFKGIFEERIEKC